MEHIRNRRDAVALLVESGGASAMDSSIAMIDSSNNSNNNNNNNNSSNSNNNSTDSHDHNECEDNVDKYNKYKKSHRSFWYWFPTTTTTTTATTTTATTAARRRIRRRNNSKPSIPILLGGFLFILGISAALFLVSVHVLHKSDSRSNNINDMMSQQKRVLYQQLTPQQQLQLLRHSAAPPPHAPHAPHAASYMSSTTTANIPLYFLPKRPRVIGWYFTDTDTAADTAADADAVKDKARTPKSLSTFLGAETIDPNMIRLTGRGSKWRAAPGVSVEDIKRQQRLLNSADYRHGRVEPFEEGDCIAQYKWQKLSYPTCNLLLEQDLTNLQQSFNFSRHHKTKHPEAVRLLANGYWRDVWKIVTNIYDPKSSYNYNNQGLRFVLKTMRYEHDYTPRNYDRHRRDAMAMEQLTASPNVVNIFAFCGNSGIFEFADGGTVEDAVWADAYDSINKDNNDPVTWNRTETLIVAYQIASGLADVHNFAKEGRPAIAHTDITPSQFVYISQEGLYKLNDFNRARFLRWNVKENTTCPFHVGNNPGTFRAPEEYKYDPETEKIDVYSMGNIFYFLITRKWPFETLSSKEGIRQVKHGKRPPIPIEITNSTDPATKAILKGIQMCWSQNPIKRASARQVQTWFSDVLTELGLEGEN